MTRSQFSPRRRPSVQVQPVRQGLHAALLAGVAHEEDPQRGAEVRLQGATQQAVRVRGVRPHGRGAGRAAGPPALAAPG